MIDLSRERELRVAADEVRAIDAEVQRLLLCRDAGRAERFEGELLERVRTQTVESDVGDEAVGAARSRLLERRVAAAGFLRLALIDE